MLTGSNLSITMIPVVSITRFLPLGGDASVRLSHAARERLILNNSVSVNLVRSILTVGVETRSKKAREKD
jgi:hypothetical protein